MNCARCGHENRHGRKFCGGCGAELTVQCSSCGVRSEPGERFCGDCGTPLAAASIASVAPADPRSYTPKHLAEKILTSRSALEGERKQVTVLFADVKGSMELAERIDPEEWHRILDRFFQILSDGVHRFEGTVNQYTGDGIMALFGAPIAHEDHARRACYAALHLQGELRRHADELRRTAGLQFDVRMGLNSGEVVVGKIGDDLRMDYTAQGHTVGLAARIEQLAEAGRAYLSEHTARLVSGFFQLRDLGCFEVKGVSGPVEVYDLEGIGSLHTPLEVSRLRGFSRFVGRVDEMAALEAALARALEESGQVVGVVGEPGLGKSRLCFEFAERCRARGITVHAAHGVSHGKLIPYLPVVELFRAFFRITEQDDDQTAREKIVERLLTLDESLGDPLPFVFDFMRVADPERPLPPMEPEARQRQLHAIVKRVVQARGRREPAVVLLEDLHWFDSGSEAVLEVLVESARATRTALVVNFRPEYHADWMQKSYYQQLPLLPLGPAAIDELLRDVLGADPSLATLAARIRVRTGGNPFFIEEMVQGLAEAGSLAGAKGAYRLLEPVGELKLPSTVQAVLAARVDRLAEPDKRVLQTAAVIGRQFSEPVLRRVAKVSEAELAAALTTLAAAEFVYEEALYPEAQYIFKHALTQEVAYHSVLGERRKILHERAARAIETLCAESLESRYGELAHHYKLSGNTEKAIDYLELAGAQAAERSANAEAESHLTAALDLLQGMPETDERARKELVAETTLASVLAVTKGFGAAERERRLERARDLSRRLGESRMLGPVLSNLFQVYVQQGRLAIAGEVAEESLSIAESLGDTGFLLSAHHNSAEACLWTGRLDGAQLHFERSIALYDPKRHRGVALLGLDPWMMSSSLLAWGEQWAGRFNRALQRIRAVVGRGREAASPAVDLAFALMMAGSVHQFRREARPTRELAEGAIAIFSEQGDLEHVGTSRWLRGWALQELGQPEEGVAEIARGMDGYRSGGSTLVLSWPLGLLAAARGKMGEFERAFDVLAEGFEIVERNGERFYEAELSRLKGELSLLRGAPRDDAEACFRRAISIARGQDAKTWELRATTSLARLLRSQGRRDEARHALGEVYRWFIEGFDTVDLKDARALLEELS